MLRALSIALLAAVVPAHSAGAQTRPAAVNPQRVASDFKAGILKGCLQNPPKDLANPKTFCTCYSEAFARRYGSRELVAIGNAAAASRTNAEVISLMMAPELKACRAQQGR